MNRTSRKPPNPALWLAIAVSSGCQEVPRTYSTATDGGTRIFSDDFSREQLGPAWHPTGDGVSIRDGRLVLRDVRNHPVWLERPLPDDVRIEFDAWATSDEGDIKVEVAGDGNSHATAPNYVASGYVLVFGGWNNTQNAIIRRDEHGSDRAQTDEPTVRPHERYHWTVIREGGEIRWKLDGNELLRFDDPDPLRGEGHRSFAFSGWQAETHFDNLVIEAI